MHVRYDSFEHRGSILAELRWRLAAFRRNCNLHPAV